MIITNPILNVNLILFQEDVLSLVLAFEDAGSPYKEESGKLFDLGLDTIYPQSKVDGISSLDPIGLQESREFLTRRVQATGEEQLLLMHTIHRYIFVLILVFINSYIIDY